MPITTRCLLCSRKLLDHQTLAQYFLKDELCDECRRSLKTRKRTIKLQNLKITSFHLYDETMSDCLIQYKECMDEALKDIFLFEVKDWIHFHYRNCVFLCAPSSSSALERRGFQHVAQMFSSCGIEIIDCFRKKEEFSQKRASMTQRSSIKELLEVDVNQIPKNKRLILIDDTVTTGSTLLALQKLVGEKRCKEALCVSLHPKMLAKYDKIRKRKCIYFP